MSIIFELWWRYCYWNWPLNQGHDYCVNSPSDRWDLAWNLRPLLLTWFNFNYSIHVPEWLQKWLNLITAPGSVSNEPGSVTWLATKYLKTVSWRNHTEKLTTLWPQNISFWPKINIPSSYFTILMLNCLENTLKLKFDSCQILDLINFKTTWLDLPTLLESVWILGWNTVKLLTGMLKSLHSLGSCAENFPLIQISSILSVIFTRPWLMFWWASCTSARHAGSFDCLMTSLILITMDNGRGHCAYWQSCKVPWTKPTEEWKNLGKCML